MPPPPDDRELDDFLSRRGELSRAYRDAQPPEKVPETIDAAVRAWARREHAQHLGPRGRWWDRAALPLGAAASLILVALLVHQGGESGVSERQAMQETLSQHPTAASAAPAPAVPSPAAANQPTPPPPPAEASKPRLDAKASSLRDETGPVSPPAGQTVSSAPARFTAAPPPPALAAEATAEEKVAQSKMEDAAAQQTARKRPSSAGAEVESLRAAAPTPAPAAPAAPAAAPAPAPAAPAMNRAALATIPSATRPMQATAAQLRQCDSSTASASADVGDLPAQIDWLSGIRALRDANQAAARAQLRCWQKRYPQSPVPGDLQDLLREP